VALGPDERQAANWPPDYASLLQELREAWQLDDDFYVSRKLAGGRSGAAVFAVDVACPHYTGHAILKIDVVGAPEWDEMSEAELHQRAFADAPDFAERHLPRLIHAHYGTTHVAILSTIASGGLQYAEAWLDSSFARQLAIVERLSIDILRDWNADYTLSKGMHDGADLLEAWLGYRIVPSDGGRLHGFLSDALGIAPDTPSILFEGRWYPNPLAFATRSVDVADPMRMRAVRGHMHGDLHGLNVLVGREATSDEDYHLIDLALYQPSQYLFYDHAYFELATLLNLRETIPSRGWDSILAQLRQYKDHDDQNLGLRTDDFGLMELIAGVRSGIRTWVASHEMNRRPSMESQAMLARVAAGLNFAHKPLSLAQRQMAFIYAAANLKDYVRLNRLDWPKSGAETEIAIAAPPVEGAAPGDAEPIRAIQPATGAIQPASAAVATPSPPAADAAPADGADRAPAATEPTPEPQRGIIRGFLGELRRRQVVKVAGVYLVMAWMTMQVVSLGSNALKLPDWSISLAATLLGVGFVVTVLMTWAFELGPAGLQRARARESGPARRSAFDNVIDFAAALGIVIIAAVSVFEFVDHAYRDASSEASGAGAQRGLAVLPFRTIGDAEDTGFADGLTIELSDTLDQTGEFRMPGVTSSFVYKDNPTNVREIGETLGVDYVVEGEVRRTEDDLRIAVRLINTDDGFAIWSGSFDEHMSDIFEAQENIAEAIGAALEVPLEISSEDLAEDRTTNAEAYELFVEALPLVMLRGENLLRARDLLIRSTELAPDFAAAWATLALTYDLIPTYLDTADGRAVVPAVFYRQAQAAALRAQRLDPDAPSVQHALANMHRRNRQWRDAQEMYEAALGSDPTDHRVMYDYGLFLVIVGKHQKAAELMARAVSFDPLNRLYRLARDTVDWQIHRDPQHLKQLAALFREGTTFRVFILRALIDAAFLTGDDTIVRDILATCDDCESDLVASALTLVEEPAKADRAELSARFNQDLLLGYGYVFEVADEELVLEIFTRLATDEYPRTQFVVVPWIVVDEVGGAPAFLEGLEDMGLPAYWQEAGPPDHCQPDGEGAFLCGHAANVAAGEAREAAGTPAPPEEDAGSAERP